MKELKASRRFIISMSVLIFLAFLAGIFLVIHGVRASASIPSIRHSKSSGMVALIYINRPAQAVEPTQTSSPTPTKGGLVSADTTGIIALAMVIVTSILVGSAWGTRKPPHKKDPPK
jgi:hypothetical protein